MMQCPKCQAENPNENRFCRECGTKLLVICPQCTAEVLPGDKFCGKCGHDMRKPKEGPPINYNQPQSYTPRFLAEKILTIRSSIEGERKLVTVLFADVANYTSIAEKLDPEEVHQIMDGCFKILMDEIHGYEGTINQFTGDGVMSLFGAPVAHEDHAQRACHAALSIQTAVGKYGEKVKKDCGLDFKIRIGLNSGPVIVGAIGDDLRMDYTAVGDTTNLASRMESMARPGTILVSSDTFRLVKDFFEFEPLGKFELKGKEIPQKAYKLLMAGEVETRIGASVAKGLTRFVGRKNSMVALREALEETEAGSGQVVGIVGEAGVGKSRLLFEFKNLLPRNEYTYLEGRCLHYGSSMSYLPFLDILRSYFDIKEGDREFIIKKKMAEKVYGLDEKLESALPPLMELLSLKVEDEDFIKLGLQQKRERTFEAIRNLLIRLSQERPLVLAVEDTHWIDHTSAAFLDYLIGWLAGTHVLLILLYRPEYTHRWSSKSYYRKIGLNQLTAKSSAELVQAILEGGEVNLEIRELVLNRTSGNPLFMEELTQTLLENGSIQKRDDQFILSVKASDIQIPETIQGIIAARMDRLEDNLKRTMQVASVIGRYFAFRILRKITGLREELKAYLFDLQGLEFIYEKSLFPELEYIFKHALTQEVAYNSLLHKRRKEIHAKIGKAIEQIYVEKLEEFYEMLAYHFELGEIWEKAVEYHVNAGAKSRKSFALQTALHYYDRAKEIMEKHSLEVPWQVRYDLFYGRGQILGEMGQWPLAYQEAMTAGKIAHREGARHLRVEALFASAFAAYFGQLFDDLTGTLVELENIVGDDPESVLGVTALRFFANFITDDIASTLSMNKKLEDLIHHTPNSPFLAPASLFVAVSHRWRGDSKKCSKILGQLLPGVKEAAPAIVYLQSVFHYGLSIGEQGRYQEAIRILEAGRQHALKADEPYSTPKVTNSLGWAHHELCLFDKAIEYNNLALDSIKVMLGPSTANLFEMESQTRVNLGENYLMIGNWQLALEYYEYVYRNALKPEYFFGQWRWKPRCLLGLGELWLHRGDLLKAQFYLDEMIEHGWTHKFPYKKFLVRSGRLQGNIYAAQSNFVEAETELQQTLIRAKQLGNPTQLWKTLQTMGNLLLKQGESGEAKAEFKSALKVVQAIAEGLTDVALKEDYLQSEPIQELFSQAEGG